VEGKPASTSRLKLVAGCWLLVAGCWLLVAAKGYWLQATGYRLPATGRLSLTVSSLAAFLTGRFLPDRFFTNRP
jgi:hypothetical protein